MCTFHLDNIHHVNRAHFLLVAALSSAGGSILPFTVAVFSHRRGTVHNSVQVASAGLGGVIPWATVVGFSDSPEGRAGQLRLGGSLTLRVGQYAPCIKLIAGGLGLL